MSEIIINVTLATPRRFLWEFEKSDRGKH